MDRLKNYHSSAFGYAAAWVSADVGRFNHTYAQASNGVCVALMHAENAWYERGETKSLFVHNLIRASFSG